MKTVLILSGGLDSTVLLYHLLDRGDEVKCLSVNYGQRHGVELGYAYRTCKKLGVGHETAQLDGITHLLKGSSQTDDSVPVPYGHYAAENMKLTVVPNRNMIMLSVAIGWAISLRYDAVAYAAHAGDHAVYPDCRPEFAERMALVALLADWHPVEMIRPFIELTKADIVRRGHHLEVPWNETWSCYEGKDVHCGKCGTCQERRWAFQAAHVSDPTIYRECPQLSQL